MAQAAIAACPTDIVAVRPRAYFAVADSVFILCDKDLTMAGNLDVTERLNDPLTLTPDSPYNALSSALR